jgi:hypothetical protein
MAEFVETTSYDGEATPWREEPLTDVDPDDDLNVVVKGNPYHDDAGKFTTKDLDADGVGGSGVEDKPAAKPKEKFAHRDKTDPELVKKVIGDYSPVELARGMLERGMPGSYPTISTWEYEGRTFLGISSGVDSDESSGGSPEQIERTFVREVDGTLTVSHSTFKLPESKRGAGIAKTVLRDSMNEYEKIGVDKIKLTANLNVGSYAWAKFGFNAKDPLELADSLRSFIQSDNLGGRRDDEDEGGWGGERRRPRRTRSTEDRNLEALRDDLNEFIHEHQTDPKLPWLVAGLSSSHVMNVNGKKYTGKEIGKRLMLETSWEAELRLDDKEAMDRFRSYVGK